VQKQYVEYYEAILGADESQCVLAEGGVILVDNVLWKGLVLAHEPSTHSHAPDPQLIGETVRMRTIAEKMHAFNEMVRRDERVEPVLLPLRDGLYIIRRKT
jgi:predicted O-methyltransferase YrrM